MRDAVLHAAFALRIVPVPAVIPERVPTKTGAKTENVLLKKESDIVLSAMRKIAEKEYVNLDFMGNLGHSIVTDKKDRIYTEKGNNAKLSSVRAFTFEPHISLPGSQYGFKMENIYCFEDDKLIEE